MSIAHTEGGDTLDSTAPPATIHTPLFPWWKFSFRVVYINKLSILSSSSHSSITRSLKLNNNNKKTPLRITASSLLPKSFLTLYQFHFSVVCDDSLFLTALSYLHLLVFLLLNSVAQSCPIQSLSRVRLLATPWTAARQASQSITNPQSLLKLMFTESVMPSNNLILCHPLLLPPSILPSIWVLWNESALHIRWPKYWSFSISPSSEYSRLISFRMDWLDLLAVQGTLKSLLQHHSSKASILRCSAFFIVQLSHPYMTTCKTIALTRWTSVDKVMSLLFNMLSKLVIIFLPRSKCLLISWLQLPSKVILESKKIKSVTVSTVSLSTCHQVMGPDTMILVFWMSSFKPTFLLSSFTQFFFAFCHKGGVICASEVIDISPSNLDSSLCFIQPSILHDVRCIQVK